MLRSKSLMSMIWSCPNFYTQRLLVMDILDLHPSERRNTDFVIL